MMQGTVRFPGMLTLRALCSQIMTGKALLLYDSQQPSLVLSLTEAAFREQPLGQVLAFGASTPDCHAWRNCSMLHGDMLATCYV